MNLKSLLIGSAAALVAAPAFAADVIIAEPEPVEYVEVCDVAGAGYFYIPGSRTCLQISGLVRHQLDFRGDRDASFVVNDSGDTVFVGGRVFAGTPAVAAVAAQNGIVVDRATGATATLAPGAAVPAGSVVLVQPVAAVAAVGPQPNTTILEGAASQDGIRSLVRGEVNIRTFTETELGDLTSFIRFRGNDRNQDPTSLVTTQDGNSFNTAFVNFSDNGSVLLNNAVIGLGGLSLGLSDSLYDGGIAGEFDSFGGTRVHFIRYTADLGAFSASISAEAERENNSQNNYVPNIVGKLSGDIGAFSLNLFAGYDDGDGADVVTTAVAGGLTLPAGVTSLTVVDEDSYSLKATASFDIGAFGVAAGATYNSANNNFSNGYEYSVAGSATVGLGEKASLTFGGQYFMNALANAQVVNITNNAANPFDFVVADRSIDAIDAYSIGAHVDYEIVDGFDVKVAVNYKDTLIDDAAFTTGTFGTAPGGTTVVDSDGAFEGFIRFDRSF